MKYDFDKDINSPSRTEEHGVVIKKKPFLKKLYIEWYKALGDQIGSLPEGKIIELGSGGEGFIKEQYPQVITSDIIPLVACDMTFSATDIPFEDNFHRGSVFPAQCISSHSQSGTLSAGSAKNAD